MKPALDSSHPALLQFGSRWGPSGARDPGGVAVPGPRGAERAGEPGGPGSSRRATAGGGRAPRRAPTVRQPRGHGRGRPSPRSAALAGCADGVASQGQGIPPPPPSPSLLAPERRMRWFLKRNKSLPIWRRWVGSLCGLCLAVWSPRVSVRARSPGAPGSPGPGFTFSFYFLLLCVFLFVCFFGFVFLLLSSKNLYIYTSDC